jgi:hypothetical protein
MTAADATNAKHFFRYIVASLVAQWAVSNAISWREA